MALVTFGGGVTAISGRVGGSVFAKTGSMRTLTPPTNPQTTFQAEVRNAVSQLTNRWVNVLTAAQRTAWEVYAANVPVTNRLGQSKLISGLAHYVRSGVVGLQSGFITPGTGPDTAPVVFDLGEPVTEMVITQNVASPATVDWQTPTDANDAILLYLSRPQNPSINFFKGPYRFAVLLDPSASPTIGVATPFAADAAGNRVFFRSRVLKADNRLSPDLTGFYAITP